ncbi:MAG: hypothetical protein D6763_09905 [Alphaproteobacteria bacterium]|nr:MAG: hypothetical protein D6763_09905 [Alphaproteobacteria bacterium]
MVTQERDAGTTVFAGEPAPAVTMTKFLVAVPEQASMRAFEQPFGPDRRRKVDANKLQRTKRRISSRD